MEKEIRRGKRKAANAAYYERGKKAARVLDEYIGEKADLEADRECFSIEEVLSIYDEGIIEPTCNSKKAEIFNRARKRISLHENQRRVCAVCDRALPWREVRKTRPTKSSAGKWCRILQGLPDVPSSLRNYYDVSSSLPLLKGALLYKNGVERDRKGDHTGYILVCKQCHRSLIVRGRLPKFAIANGFDIGIIPTELSDVTNIEKRLTSLTTMAMPVTILQGGKHKSVKGHVSVIRMNPAPIVNRLPYLIQERDETFMVIMAGHLTPAQEILGMRRHITRVKVVEGLLKFYVQHKNLYKEAGVTIDEDAIAELEERGMQAGVTVYRVPSIGNECSARLEDLETTEVSEDIAVSKCLAVPVIESETAKQFKGNSEAEGAVESQYVETFSIHVLGEPNTSIEALKTAEKALLVRNSGELVSDYQREMLGLAFPHLFPYSRGHPGTEIEVPVSGEECCRHYIILSNRRFAQDTTFVMVAFDVCGRQKVAMSTALRSKSRPGEFEKLGKGRREELAKAVREKMKRREEALEGRSVRVSEESKPVERAQKLLRNVRISQSYMWASPEERLVYRRRAFSMDAFFKTGAIFVTITPSDVGSLLVSMIAGKVSSGSVERMLLDDLPSHAQRIALAGLDGAACAEYFELICEAFIEDIVCFDLRKGLPYRGGGLFGVVRAFVGVVESQQSGTLHMHAVLFVAGLPRSHEEFVSKCKDTVDGNLYREPMSALVDSVVSTSLPCDVVEGTSPLCPSCNGGDTLRPIKPFSSSAYKKQSPRSHPIPTSACINCGNRYGACEVLRSEVKRLHDSLEGSTGAATRIPFGETSIETDRMTEKHILKPNQHLWPPFQEPTDGVLGRLHRLRLCRVLLLTQQHNFRHAPSCLKSSGMIKTGDCRYLFPRVGGVQTHIGDSHCLVLARSYHNEYINNYNDVMALTFGTNHDIRFLVGGTTDALYYCLKYTTKVQTGNEGLENTLMTAYDRRRGIEEERIADGTPMEDFTCGKSRVNSMAMALSKRHEVAAPMCALYLRRKSALYTSHNFYPLLLGQSMAIVTQEEHETELVRSVDGAYVRASQHMDYVYGPKSLSNITLTEFVSQYGRAKRRKGQIACEHQDFLEGHCLRDSHFIQKRRHPVIPDIIGPRIPDLQLCTTSKEEEKYALIALILFYPYHASKHICQGYQSYWEAFEIFKASGEMSKSSKQMLDNMQEYYNSKRLSAVEQRIRSEISHGFTEEDALDPVQNAVEQPENDFFEEDELDRLDIFSGMESVDAAKDGVESEFTPHILRELHRQETNFGVNAYVPVDNMGEEGSSVWPLEAEISAGPPHGNLRNEA